MTENIWILAALCGVPWGLAIASAFRRRSLWLRYMAIILAVAGGGLRLWALRWAARAVQFPSLEMADKLTKYGDAWNDGRFAAQEVVNTYPLSLVLLFACLAFMAAVPRRA